MKMRGEIGREWFLIVMIKTCSSFRRPHETELRPEAGSSWGSWGGDRWCPENSWAAGFQLLVEYDCGNACDDTALNGVKLLCYTKDGQEVGSVTSKIGSFGSWRTPHMCSSGFNNFLDSIQFKSERETVSKTRGKRNLDETAGNNVNMGCLGGDLVFGDGEHWEIGLIGRFVLKILQYVESIPWLKMT